MTENDRRHIEEFCIHYRAEQLALDVRFFNLLEAAKSGHPTLWEKVLQTYPAGGIGNSYPWLGSVKSSIWFKLIRSEWSKLRAELEPDAMARLTKWVRDHATLLQFKPNMPDEPEPLNFRLTEY